MTTFALVHGAWHGAWCWERLVPELGSRGHRAIAMSLPSDEPSATFADYAGAVVDALDGEEDEVVVVGHSLAGHTIPLVAAQRRVRRLVYLCALVPVPGRSFAEQLATETDILNPGYLAGLGEVDDAGNRAWADRTLARELLFGDCDDRWAQFGLERLRGQSRAPYGVPCPLDAFPPAPATYVVCTEDRLVLPAGSRRVAQERLGVDVVELPGGHSPFLSRPAALADLLDRVA